MGEGTRSCASLRLDLDQIRRELDCLRGGDLGKAPTGSAGERREAIEEGRCVFKGTRKLTRHTSGTDIAARPLRGKGRAAQPVR